ncbi:MAG: glycosyltransferase [Flavobacteriales bacterium]|jgi:glycosyltransferase involved in cell wall biosynthesis|nr:glycosyltransferase [Flavobacteriales bacterium]
MHVLFHSSWYPSRLHPTLGNFVQRHAEAVATRHRVTVLHTVADPAVRTLEVHDARRGDLRELIAYHPPGRIGPQAALQALRQVALHADRADVLHGHVLKPAAMGMLWLRRKFDLPLIVTEHWTGYHRTADAHVHWAMRTLMRRAAAKAAFLCPVSDDLGRAMRGFGLHGRYRTVPNVVDTTVFTPATVARPDGRFRLLHVSTLHDPQKNISGLLRAFAEARVHEPALQLVLAGDGDAGAYRPLAASLGLHAPDLIMHGAFPPEGIARLMHEADAFVLASRYENMPCVLLEAMATGLPVLSTRVGGIAEQVGARQGLLVPPDDHRTLVDGLVRMAKERDRFDRPGIGTYAAERFSVPVVAAAYDTCYREAMGG